MNKLIQASKKWTQHLKTLAIIVEVENVHQVGLMASH
jgi:hypothetical protein